jgi:hypothetical protein
LWCFETLRIGERERDSNLREDDRMDMMDLLFVLR